MKLKFLKFYISIKKLLFGKKEYVLTPIQERGLVLWKEILINKNSTFSCSINKQIREISCNDIKIILSPINEVEYNMNIIHKSELYQIFFDQDISKHIIFLFDEENDKRMKYMESLSNNTIRDNISQLVISLKETRI